VRASHLLLKNCVNEILAEVDLLLTKLTHINIKQAAENKELNAGFFRSICASFALGNLNFGVGGLPKVCDEENRVRVSEDRAKRF